ncbi:MAG: Fur family transcriptional regulator [Acidimicrobiales bacterium]|jgi:Fur family ferric uptake transcriptional regulator|nr:transcriptional repressor [Actinomycetota bacterium]MDA8185970.1 transcriptional repressor [Actinomycetota bacterium]
MGRRPRIPAALEELLRSGGRHAWSLEELHEGLVASGVAADFSSVFRAAAKLESDGVLQRVELGDGRARFEMAPCSSAVSGHEGHHDHVRCEACGAVVPVSCGVVSPAVSAIEAATGFAIGGHSLVLTGTCRECRGDGR